MSHRGIRSPSRLLIATIVVCVLGAAVLTAIGSSGAQPEKEMADVVLPEHPYAQQQDEEDRTGLVPFYTFSHTDLLFLGLRDGTMMCLDVSDGDEIWRLDTGGAMVQSLVTRAPSATVQRVNPLSMPFGVRGQWLHTRDPSGRVFSENPFMHMTQLLQRPLIMDDATGTEIVTTASAQHFDVDEKGLQSFGNQLPPLPTVTPSVRVMRYNVHISAQGSGFKWNMTISTIKVTMRMPTLPDTAEALEADRLRPFKESHDRTRGHVVADEVLGFVSYVVDDHSAWRHTIPTSPVVAFLWVGQRVEHIDLLGTDHRRMMQLALPEVAPNANNAFPFTDESGGDFLLPAAAPGSSHNAALSADGRTRSSSYADDSHWVTISRMHIFVIASFIAYLIGLMAILFGVFQRSSVIQWLGQFEKLENAFREQEKVVNNAQPVSQTASTILGPMSEATLTPMKKSKSSEVDWDPEEEEEDSESYWELPPPQHSADRFTAQPAPMAASLFSLHFTVNRRIASGGGGAVFEARHKMTDITYAIKVISLSAGDEERVKREAVLHSKLEHKNVVRFFYCWTEELSAETQAALSLLDSNDEESEFSMSTMASTPPSTPTMSRDANNGLPKFVFIQMEYFKNGTLCDYLKSRGKAGVNREENLSLLLMMVRGLEYIHACGVVHRDLKPTNIFMSDDFTAKIGDFGLSFNDRSTAHELAEAVYANEGTETFGVGSPLYSSPEQLETGKATAASDVFALGILAGEMYHTFETTHERMDVLQRMRSHIFEPEMLEKYSQEVELFKKMTAHNPRQRVPLKEVHEILRKLLKAVRSPSTKAKDQ